MPKPYTYTPEKAEILKKSMSQGYSFEASCSILNICRKTGYNWVDRFEEFAQAKSEGEAAALRFLEAYALSALTGTIPEAALKKGAKRIDTTMAIFFLKTRFHRIYGDKMKLESADSESNKISIEMNYKKPGGKKKKSTKKTTKK